MSSTPAPLPATLKPLADEQGVQRGFGTGSGFVSYQIRKDQDRLHLRGLLLVGAATAPAAPVGGVYFEALRGTVRKSAAAGDRE